MKKKFILLVTLFASLSFTIHAQLTGTKSIPGDYATLAAAITDLNAQGVGGGGVTFNVAAGHVETAPAGGYTITASGTAANQIIFQKSGAGTNPTFTASAALTAGSLTDGLIKIVGGDYITINGFTLQENAANTTTAAGTNNMTEWGVALLYTSQTDGASNNTIQNCTITLNRTYANSIGVYSNVRHSATNATTTADITAATGANNNNKIYTNAINNVNIGVIFIGSLVAANMSTGNDIGGATAGTGNNITNYGGLPAASAFVGFPTTIVAGAYINNEINFNLSNNSFISANLSTATALRGILTDYGTVPTGTITNNINGNTVTFVQAGAGGLQGITAASGAGAATGVTLNMNANKFINNVITTPASAITMFGLANLGAFGTFNLNDNIIANNTSSATTGGFVALTNNGAGAAIANTISISNNHIGDASGPAITFTVATSGAVQPILNSGGAVGATLNINGNDIRGLVHNATATSAHTYIFNTIGLQNTNINNNTFTNLNVNTTGSITFISNSISRPANAVCNVNSNSVVTAFNKPAAGGTILFYNSFSFSPPSVTETNTGNNFSNITVTGATTITGWQSADGSGTSPFGPSKTITNNTFTNISGGTSPITCLIGGFSNNATANNVSGNTISNITSTGGAINGIASGGGSQNFINNNVNTLIANGAAVVNGISITAGGTQNISKNRIYNLQSINAGGSVNGISFSGGTGTTISNNLIGDLKAPLTNSTADAIRGISVTSTTATTTVNVYYNTIHLNAVSSGTNFSTSGIFHTVSATATTATLDMRNNIIYNASLANGTGRTIAYRRSGTALGNYAATSNNNLFFVAAAPSAVIFFDGTNADATLSAYQTRVAPRDAASKTELSTPFLSISGAAPDFLHINTTIPTVAEGGGAAVAGIADDFDGDTRNVTTPDIGADEFAGIQPAACVGTPVAGTITGNALICAGQSSALTLSGYSVGTGISIQWKSSTVSGGPYNNIVGATSGAYNTGALATGTYYFVATVICANGGASANTTEFVVTVNANPVINISPTTPSICIGGTGVPLTASGADTYIWTPATGLSGIATATVTANPTVTTLYTVTGTVTATGCNATGIVTVTVSAAPTINSVTATPARVCLNGNSQLLATATAPGVPTGSPYSVAGITGQTYTPLAGAGITIINTVAGLTSTFGGNTQDDGGVVISIPFTFTYMGNTFTQMSMSTNGWVGAGNQGTIGAADSRAPGNLFTATVPNNTIAAWFRDMGANFPLGTGSLRHGLIGTDVYAFQWDNAVGSGFSDGSAVLISFQVNIYGPASATPGRIEMIYGPTAGAISTAGSAIGLENGTGGTNNYLNALTGNGTATTTSSVWPGNGNGFRYDPVTASFAWTPSLFLGATNIANPMASNMTTSNTYTVTATSGGCSATQTVTVLVDNTPAPSILPTTATICNGVVQALTATSISTGAVSNTSSGAITVNVPDNDPAGASHTIAVSGIPANAVLSNISVRFNMSQASDGHMTINLKAPNNNILNLVNNRGGSGDNFINTTISSIGGLPNVSTGTAPFSNAYAPDGIMGEGATGNQSNVALFTGLFSTPNGNWTLIMDDNAAGDLAALTSWTITIYYFIPDATTWAPLTGLYTNIGGTTPYAGTNLATVYAKPTVTTTYTVTGATTAGCNGTANVVINVNQPPSVGNQPNDQSLCPGNTATFSVTANGAGLTYQWRKGGVNINDGGNISGATTSILTITNLTLADAGNYDVVISGTCTPNATSNAAVLSVGAAPLITTQPQSQFVCGGNTFSLTVAAGGSGLTYQWRKAGVNLNNGGNIAGATSATLTVSNAAAGDAGNYDVIVTNSCAQSSTSNAAVITFSTANRWLGTSNASWGNAANWCNGVPTSTTDVVIPSGTTFAPIINTNASVRDLNINAGATLTLTVAGGLDIYGTNLTVGGTFTTAPGTIGFRNTANLNVPALTVASLVMNGAGGITMTGNLNVTTALTLTNGNITLGTNNLVMAGGTTGSAASHVVTNGTGVVTNNAVAAATVIFPVAPTATSYNPVWIANGQGLNYSVRVATGVPGTLANGARAINRTWTVTASGVPAANANITFGYADADANASATPTANMEVGYYNGTAWVLTTPAGGAAPSGTATARLVATASRTFGTMVVANTGGINTPTGTPNIDVDLYSVKMMPNIVEQESVLRVMSRRSMKVEWTVTDITGRIVMKLSQGVLAGQNDIRLRLGHLASGTYQVTGYTEKGQTQVIKFIRL